MGDERFPEAVGVEQPSFLGTNTDQTTPVQVGAATTWVSVSADSNHTCAIKTNGRLLCWGSDTHGQVGDGGTFTDQPEPVQVA